MIQPAGAGPANLQDVVLRTARALLDGTPCVALIGEAGPARTEAVEILVRHLVALGFRFEPLDGAAGQPADVRRVIDELSGETAEAAGAPQPTVLLIDAAEALRPPVLEFLHLVASAFAVEARTLQLLFVGTAGFDTMLEREELRGLREQIGAWVRLDLGIGWARPAAPPPAPAPSQASPQVPAWAAAERPAPVLRSGPMPWSVPPPLSAKRAWPTSGTKPARSRGGGALWAALGGVAMVGAVAAALLAPRARAPTGAPGEKPGATAAAPAAVPVQPAPPTAAPAAPAQVPPPAPAPAAQPAAPPTLGETDRARLARDFDAFIARQGGSASRLSPADRAALFQQFLSWRTGAAAPPAAPAAAPPAAPAAGAGPLAGHPVVVHYAADNPGAEAEARQLAATLAGRSAGTELRAESQLPGKVVIRFHDPADHDAARDLGAQLAASLGPWALSQDTRGTAKGSPGTIDLWLPAR